MCGIVGFLARTETLRASIGEWVTPMLVCMGDRGSDSAGLAVFSAAPNATGLRFNLYADAPNYDWQRLQRELAPAIGSTTLDSISHHGVLITTTAAPEVLAALAGHAPGLHVLSVGHHIDLYKDTGHPREIAARYGFSGLSGSHAVGHTRMATESAVSPAHSHPFTAGQDFCLVHNGSLSNPYSLRRMLERRGIAFETDNDTEAACRFIEWRLREGDTLEAAIERCFEELDGFYTLLMATADKMLLVRDPFACKPAIVAETADYVAVASEFRTLAHLPGIADAKLYEPAPEVIYSWSR